MARACAVRSKRLTPTFGRGKKLGKSAGSKVYRLELGPFAGMRVRLFVGTTLPITCKGMAGQYIGGKWIKS